MRASQSRYVVISADTHGGVKPAGYREYLDAEFRDDLDDWLANAYPAIEQRFYAGIEEMAKGWGADEEGSHVEDFLASLEAGMGDAAHRVRALEADGVVASIIYPGASFLCAPPFAGGAGTLRGEAGGGYSRAHRVAGVRAYNRWLADYCSEYPTQLKGVIEVVDYDDLDEAIGLIEEAARAGLTGGIPLPGMKIENPGLHDTYWDRLWSVCEEHQLPVNDHVGWLPDPRMFGSSDPASNGMLLFATAHNLFPLPVAIFMVGGVLDRHPTLRIVFAEQYADWIPREISTLQERLGDGPGARFSQALSLDPRGYWERNFAVGATFMTPNEAQMRHDIGLSTIMWGSDFPHPEGTYPHTRASLQLSFSSVPEDELRMILGGNAARVYGFDLEALQPVADRVGPTVDELATPLDRVPKGFRRFSLKPSEDRDLAATV